jgi:hypothetical protein
MDIWLNNNNGFAHKVPFAHASPHAQSKTYAKTKDK